MEALVAPRARAAHVRVGRADREHLHASRRARPFAAPPGHACRAAPRPCRRRRGRRRSRCSRSRPRPDAAAAASEQLRPSRSARADPGACSRAAPRGRRGCRSPTPRLGAPRPSGLEFALRTSAFVTSAAFQSRWVAQTIAAAAVTSGAENEVPTGVMTVRNALRGGGRGDDLDALGRRHQIDLRTARRFRPDLPGRCQAPARRRRARPAARPGR